MPSFYFYVNYDQPLKVWLLLHIKEYVALVTVKENNTVEKITSVMEKSYRYFSSSLVM